MRRGDCRRLAHGSRQPIARRLRETAGRGGVQDVAGSHHAAREAAAAALAVLVRRRGEVFPKTR